MKRARIFLFSIVPLSAILFSCGHDASDLLFDKKTPSGVTSGGTGGVTVAESGGSTTATEGGAGDSYTLVLTTQPTADVTITVSPGSQATVTPTSVTFTNTCPGATCWSTPQTVTVAAVDDGLVEGNHTGTITHTATSADAAFNGISITAVTVGITDNDSAGVSIVQSSGSTTATEGGAGDSYTVVLTTQPTASVTITVSPDGQATATPTPLTFTAGACPGPGNWCTAQTVTVGAVNDAIAEGAHNGTITHTAASADGAYNAIAIGNVTVNITDNDTAGVSITQSAGTTTATEGGAGDSYTVVLTSQPTASVTITVSPDAQVTATPTPLTFTAGACPGPGNWCTAQTVTVAAVDDVVVEGAHNGTITHTAASADGVYNGIAIASVTVNIADNDIPATVTNVTSPLGDGSYASSGMITIDIEVTFSQIVFVTGTPRVTMATGTPPTFLAMYASGSGTNTLTFSFTTTAGMNTLDFEYASTSALSLSGGTIKNGSGVPAALTLPALGGLGSLAFNKAIVLF